MKLKVNLTNMTYDKDFKEFDEKFPQPDELKSYISARESALIGEIREWTNGEIYVKETEDFYKGYNKALFDLLTYLQELEK